MAAGPVPAVTAAGMDSPTAASKAVFRQPHFADEVSDWLAHRATPTEVQRYDRYMQLINQAAGAQNSPSNNKFMSACPARSQGTSPASSSSLQPHSSIAFSTAPAGRTSPHTACKLSPDRVATAGAATAATGSPKSRRPATANVDSPTWHHAATKHAAAKPAATGGCRSDALSPAHSLLVAHGIQPLSPAVTSSPVTSDKLAAVSAAAAASKSNSSESRTTSAAAGGAAADSMAAAKCVNITTAQAFHGLKELYPDLWADTTPICRPEPAPNKNFISEWGEALKQGAGEAWAPYLASTYQVANLQVAKPTGEFVVRADDALTNWAAKQKLYFGDLLTPEASAAVAAMLEGKATADSTANTAAKQTAAALQGQFASLPLSVRKDLLEMLRQLAAVVQPDRTTSTTHTVHKPQYSVEQSETTALMKEQTRIRTMGFPRKVEVKGFTATTGAAATAAAAAGSQTSSSSGHAGNNDGTVLACKSMHQTVKAPKASNMIDTLMSKVPLKWAASSVMAPASSYTASFGENLGRTTQMHKTMFKEVNVGFGHVDQQLYPAGSGIYPVEQLYLTSSPVPGEAQHEADHKTTMRQSYKPRDPEGVARSVTAAREQIEASQAARNKSFIPLSKAGIQLGSSAQWQSTYGGDFIPRKADLSANKAMATAVAGIFNGPTIAYGKIAGMRADDAAAIAKWKAEQEAKAAAKAAAEAALDKFAAGQRS